MIRTSATLIWKLTCQFIYFVHWPELYISRRNDL